MMIFVKGGIFKLGFDKWGRFVIYKNIIGEGILNRGISMR